jgi:hypothetical protein
VSPGFGARTWAAPSWSIWLPARELGYRRLIPETGNRQIAAIIFYEKRGFRRIALFGEHVNDATSLCYELQVERQRQAMEV